jgi:hypothetical protein
MVTQRQGQQQQRDVHCIIVCVSLALLFLKIALLDYILVQDFFKTKVGVWGSVEMVFRRAQY